MHNRCYSADKYSVDLHSIAQTLLKKSQTICRPITGSNIAGMATCTHPAEYCM